MRQWDTKKRFEPRYRLVAQMVFLGWLMAIAGPNTNWRYAWREFCDGLLGLGVNILGLLLGIVLLVLSPIAFPVLCVFERRTARRRRLKYLRVNRKADEDI